VSGYSRQTNHSNASTTVKYRQITITPEDINGYGASTEAALTVKMVICICGEDVG
jgi:hypothetical protein